MSSQEDLWRGQFGSDYHNRQPDDLGCRLSLFCRALSRTNGIRSVIEFGAGAGDNIRALMQLLPQANFAAVEINSKAAVRIPTSTELWVAPTLTFNEEGRTWDLVLTRGFLIHVPPEDLEQTYAVLYRCSARWILLCEYFSPSPREVSYRGQESALWARNHVGEMMQKFPGLRLADYGFVSRLDPWPQDDITFWLLSK